MLQKGGIKYIGYDWSQVVPKVTEKPIREVIRARGSPTLLAMKIRNQ